MRALPVVGIGCVLLILSCGSDADERFTDGNADPQRAECETRAVLSCTRGSACNEWYSDEAANAIYSTCVQLGWTIRSEPCASTFSECCIHIEGSGDYPEGICLSSSDPDLASFKSECASSPGDPQKWCSR